MKKHKKNNHKTTREPILPCWEPFLPCLEADLPRREPIFTHEWADWEEGCLTNIYFEDGNYIVEQSGTYLCRDFTWTEIYTQEGVLEFMLELERDTGVFFD